MTSTTPTLTYFATVQNQNGTERRIAITLPFISSIADLPRYTEPPEPPLTKVEKPPRWSEKLIRRTLGRDRRQTAQLLNRIGYERAVRRIERGGV